MSRQTRRSTRPTAPPLPRWAISCITEGAATDFAAGNNQTLILTVPTGWRFNPGVGTVTFTGSRNITAATISVTASTLTVTFSVNGIDKLDVLTIGGVQVQVLDGANLAAADYIRNVFDNPGTAVIAGIEQDFTTFGLLNELAGAARALAMQTQPGASATAGALFSPQPAVKWWINSAICATWTTPRW